MVTFSALPGKAFLDKQQCSLKYDSIVVLSSGGVLLYKSDVII